MTEAVDRSKLRVGTVPYVVARPLDGGPEGLAAEPDVELVQDVPARLVEALRENRLDVALVSSIELFRKPGYRYLSGLAVAGEGRVSSVQVFLRRPLAEVRSVALDPASRAAATLTRVVMAEHPERLPAGEELAPLPTFVEVEPDEDPRAAAADAWLRIGDRALIETFAADAPRASGAAGTLNPSECWRELTGLPFVFAVWMARPEVDLEPWVGAFARAHALGASRVRSFADRAAGELRLPREALAGYLGEECRFRLDPLRQAASLLAFRDRAARLDLCDPGLKPGAIGVPPAPPTPPAARA